MQYLDSVMVKVSKEEYIKRGIKEGMVGFIVFPEIRGDTFCVSFQLDEVNSLTGSYLAEPAIKIEDLEVVKSFGTTDEEILEALPNQDPRWWCKVEDGYIINLKGERKNKIPYDYNS